MIKLLFRWGRGIKVWHCEVLLVRAIHYSVGKKLIVFSSFFFTHTQRRLKRWHSTPHVSLLNLIAVTFTWVTVSEGVTTRWHRPWLCKHADKFLKHDITLVYIGSALAHTRYFSCLDHSAAVGMCTALCIPLLIEELAQWFQPLPYPRVASLRYRGLNGAMGHDGDGVRQPVGRWEGGRAKSPAVAEEMKQRALNFWWAASIPCTPGKGREASPARRAWQGAGSRCCCAAWGFGADPEHWVRWRWESGRSFRVRHAVMLWGKEAGTVIAGQQNDPQGSPGAALLLFHHSSAASGRD